MLQRFTIVLCYLNVTLLEVPNFDLCFIMTQWCLYFLTAITFIILKHIISLRTNVYWHMFRMIKYYYLIIIRITLVLDAQYIWKLDF